MKKYLIIAVALFLGIFIVTSSAMDVTRFGPKQYVRATGKPQTVTDTFASYAGAGQIIVENGDASGGHRISSAVITLNGQQVFGPSSFNQNVGHLEAPVNLLVNNTLSVELRSKPGSYLTVKVIQDVTAPTASITAEPQAIILGGSATLSWTSTKADQVTIDPGIGEVEPSGSLIVTPQETTTYTITATNDGGTATASAQVTVYIPPTCQISVSPETITKGETATLSWTSTNAEQATIDQGIGTVPVSGSLTITPSQTTTYTINVQGPGGHAQASTTITVTNPYPTVEISADPTVIAKGGSTTLTWTSMSAQSASIDNGVGTVPLTGSVTVSPVATTTYTITVSGPLGVANAKATVAVQAPVEPQPEGSFGEGYQDLIPADSSIGKYDAKRFSVVTGLVHDQGGAPLTGVAVTILGHPEYGTAFTDGAGRYSLPVEGGAIMTVACEYAGLITAHRKVDVPWNDIAIVETMVMIPYDQKATTITFDGNPNTIITHQSTPVSDQWGTRSATMVFTGDNQAYLVDKNGKTLQQLTTITARATEFTTPESMPAKLPPNSAYTYCVELNVDGAERVKFQKPVVTWVDNFLGFPVGEPVPVGYYDVAKGLWVPSDNGRVVKLLDTNADGIVDALDATGDNQPDDLNNNGSFSDEVTGLGNARQYHPGATFWRFAVPHFFSVWDCNWPRGIASGATGPNPTGEAEADQQKDEGEDCLVPNSSFAEARSRIFHEDIPIPGTDFTLHYASNRVGGYRQVITVPASGATVPSVLKRIIVRVEVAGRTLEQILDPLPNLTAEFAWDGLDYLGREVMGSVSADVSIGFVYDEVYYAPATVAPAFGQAGLSPTTILTREERTLWKYDSFKLSKGVGNIAKDWTLSAHHYLSATDPTILHKGDGATIQNNANIIDTVAGGGSPPDGLGDGGPANKAQLYTPRVVTMDAAGNFYIADYYNHRIRKVDTNGIITTVAGNGVQGYSGDGGPAAQAQLFHPYSVTVDSQGNLYIADENNYRIRKVFPSGIITTVAGSGPSWPSGGGFSGDGGAATEALLNAPRGVAVDAQGNIYIGDNRNQRIRKVDTNGIITTVAGNGIEGFSGDGGPATAARLRYPHGVAVDAQGNLYIADASNHRIRKVDASGIITTVAGNGNAAYSGDGGPAPQAGLNYPLGMTLDMQGNLYLADAFNHRIRTVDQSGIITTVAGSGIKGFSSDDGPATEAQLDTPTGVTVDSQGNLYIADYANHRIRKVGPPAVFENFITGGDIPFADENGLGYIMASSGRHKQTFDLDTGIVLYEFGYDDNKNLVSITDRFGNQTTITRDGNGTPSAITSPDGITTTLTIDGNNHLTGITYPDGSVYGFEYTSDGLMTAKIEPEGNRFGHTFDAAGRLTAALDEEGGHWQYAREAYPNGDIQTEILTAEGDLTTYLDHTYSTGAYTSTITDPTGAQTTYARSADGLAVNKNLPCGMKLAFKHGVDSEYKYQVVTGMWEDTPAGLERITLMNKTYQDTNSDKVPDRITETVTVNSKATALVTNTLAGTKGLTSPVGRSVTTYYDPNTLLTSRLTIPGLYDTTYGYDAKGRLAAIKTNTRQTDFTYNSQGFLESITDPENHTTWYAYDAVGRMTSIARPDNSAIGFAYDTNGNMVVLATPTDVQHLFGYNKVNLNSVYQAPISGQYQYYYDRDRRLTRIHFPSGLQINNIYNNGRLAQIRTPEGNIDFSYYCGNMVSSITNGTETVAYGYDGQLLTSETLSGTLNQTLGYAYNTDFNLTGFTYAGDTTAYTYDNDGLLTKAGAFTITRDAANGLPTAVTGGALSLTRAFNGYGEVDSETFAVNSQDVTSWSLARDKAGRIIEKTEEVGGITSQYRYTYDAMGRLLSVVKDGALVEQYQYNQNGTRIYEANSLRGISGRTFTYSDEDHLLTSGSTLYQYDADGFLVNKTTGSGVTEYAYSSRGELLQVKLPDGRVIEYIHDPLGRRIAKLVNGAIIEKYFWHGLTQLLAIYDGSNNLIMRFEYTDSRMPLAMTSGGSVYYLTYDQVGSLRVISDATGNVAKRIDYDSFGNIIGDSNPGFAVPFGFAGGLHDRDTGLVRFGFRDYESDIGRWSAKDPVGFWGGDIDLYGYCLSDPINWLDSVGLWAKLVLDRSTGLLTGIDDDGHLIMIPVKEGGVSITPNDPYGRNGPLPPGHYNVNPRPENLDHPCRPTISSPGQDWNTVVTPMGTVRYGIQIHPGTKSKGCLITRPDTNDYERLLEFINDEYNDGGVTLDVFNSTNWLGG